MATHNLHSIKLKRKRMSKKIKLVILSSMLLVALAVLATLLLMPSSTDYSSSIKSQPQKKAQEAGILAQIIQSEAGVSVESEIFEELASAPSTRVIVMLKEKNESEAEASMQGAKDAFEQRKIIINENQGKVLSTLSEADFRIKHRYATINAFSGYLTPQGLSKLNNNPNVRLIEMDREVHISMAESAPLVGANTLWAAQFNSTNITGDGETVCVIDTGIDYAHSDLGGCLGTSCKVLSGYDFVNSDSDPIDDNGHGTHVAGTVASTNKTYRGVAPGSKLIAMKVLDAAGSGSFSNAVAAIDWCVNNKTKFNISVISMSLGDGGQYNNATLCNTASAGISINAAIGQGIFVAVASGNNAYTNGISYPACVTNATSVGAVYDNNLGSVGWGACTDTATSKDKFACFTNRDELLDVLAPGYAIYSTKIGGGFTTKGGTSMSTPHVAGAAALLQNYNKKLYGTALTPQNIESILKSRGKSVYDSSTGLTFPRINATNSVYAIQTCTDSDSDGYNSTEGVCGTPDCDDSNNAAYPGATEICNNVDDDCDGVIDEGTDCKLSFKNSSGTSMASFDYSGNLVLRGVLQQSSTDAATANDEFRFQNRNSEDVAIIDLTNGNMYIDGVLYVNQGSLNPSSSYDFIIKNTSSNAVAYISETGDLFLKGTLTQSGSP